jgi:hypothetical protein
MGIALGQILDQPLETFIPAAVSVLDQWPFQCSCKAREDREMYLLQDIRLRSKPWYGHAEPVMQFNVVRIIGVRVTQALVRVQC